MKDIIDSVGTLYATQDMFQEIGKRTIHEIHFLEGFHNYGTSTAKAVMELSKELSWITIAESGQIVPTKAGINAHLGDERFLKLRHQLESAITVYKPAWAAVMTKGRCEAQNTLPVTIKQCFKEAMLFDCPPQEINLWWDRLANIMREESDRRKLEIGRRGEILTIKHEYTRTGVNPEWKAIESSYAGYDVLSIKGKDSKEPLRIEVKASTRQFSSAEMHITQNEWETATTDPTRHTFHFWILNTETLYIIQTSRIGEHIPQNKKAGRWEITQIPLRALTEEKYEANL